MSTPDLTSSTSLEGLNAILDPFLQEEHSEMYDRVRDQLNGGPFYFLAALATYAKVEPNALESLPDVIKGLPGLIESIKGLLPEIRKLVVDLIELPEDGDYFSKIPQCLPLFEKISNENGVRVVPQSGRGRGSWFGAQVYTNDGKILCTLEKGKDADTLRKSVTEAVEACKPIIDAPEKVTFEQLSEIGSELGVRLYAGPPEKPQRDHSIDRVQVWTLDFEELGAITAFYKAHKVGPAQKRMNGTWQFKPGLYLSYQEVKDGVRALID